MQARFNVTKTSNSSMSDTEIKQNIIRLITAYFNVNNWDFGEDFYFTELAAYIHNNMIGEISQITIQPVGNTENTTDLFEISSNADELFLPIVKTSNITVTQTVQRNSTTIGETSSGTIASTGSSTSGGSGGGGYY